MFNNKCSLLVYRTCEVAILLHGVTQYFHDYDFVTINITLPKTEKR